MLEGGAHQSTANTFSCGRLFPNLAAVNACVATTGAPLLLEDSPRNQQVGLLQVPIKLPLCLDPSAYEVLCVPFKSEVSFFHLLKLLKLSPSWPLKPNTLGFFFPGAGPWAEEPYTGNCE